MRKITVLSYITLDGVMQAAGAPEAGFEYGGWSAPYYDEALDEIAEKQKVPASDLLLGRKTFEMFAGFWPDHEDIWPGVNDVTKYAVSTTVNESDWKNSVFLKSVDDIKKVKNSEGADLQVHGSGNLIQTLLKHDLVDELWLKIYPLTLGSGKRLFADGTMPAAFKVTESTVSSTGIIIAKYERAGAVTTGSLG